MLSQMVEHQARSPERCDQVGDAFPALSNAEPCMGPTSRRCHPFGQTLVSPLSVTGLLTSGVLAKDPLGVTDPLTEQGDR